MSELNLSRLIQRAEKLMAVLAEFEKESRMKEEAEQVYIPRIWFISEYDDEIEYDADDEKDNTPETLSPEQREEGFGFDRIEYGL